jgi:hypothetical protein
MKRAMLLLVIVAAAVFGLTLLVRAERLRSRVKASLERALQREVDVNGSIDYKWITGPGLEISDVVIHEDPKWGREPIAYVTALEATPRWLALLQGRIEFSSLRLIEPSLNVMRTDAGALNVRPFLEGVLATREGPRLPEIQVSDGRVNFKQGQRKSIFYLTSVEMDLRPTESTGFNVRVAAEAARTDRPPMGYGSFSGQGRLQLRSQEEPVIDLTLDLDRTPLTDLVVLAQNRRSSLGGRISARARLTGPMSKPRIDGRIDLEGFQRWNIPGWRPGAITQYYRGHLDMETQTVQLDTLNDPNAETPVRGRVRATAILTKPRWGAILVSEKLPLTVMVDTAKLMGFRLPEGFVPVGTATGAIGISSSGDWQGGFVFTAPDVKGRYEIAPGQARPHRISLEAGDADISEWSRNLRLPDWMTGVRTQGTFEGRSLAVTENLRFRGVRASWTIDDDRMAGIFAARSMAGKPELRAVRTGFNLQFTPRGIVGQLTGVQAANDTVVYRGSGEILPENRFVLDLGLLNLDGRAWPPEVDKTERR